MKLMRVLRWLFHPVWVHALADRLGPAPKTTFKYHLKMGNRVIFRGITDNLERRQAGHQAHFPGTRIKQVGRRTTREAALRWELEGGKRGYRGRGVK